MAKKGSAYHTPPKRFVVPNDITVLEKYGKMLANAMRATYQWRMKEVNKK